MLLITSCTSPEPQYQHAAHGRTTPFKPLISGYHMLTQLHPCSHDPLHAAASTSGDCAASLVLGNAKLPPATPHYPASGYLLFEISSMRMDD
jgi:hypothetical protein